MRQRRCNLAVYTAYDRKLWPAEDGVEVTIIRRERGTVPLKLDWAAIERDARPRVALHSCDRDGVMLRNMMTTRETSELGIEL
jgi:hypothetical protein